MCFLAIFVPLKGIAAYLGGRVHLQMVSRCLWKLKKPHNHSFGLIRSQAEPFIVWRKGELERRFLLDSTFYFKVYLCEERQFIALFLKNSWPLLSLVLEGICGWQWGQRERFGCKPRRHRERRRGLYRSQLSPVWKPRTIGLSFRHESEVKCLGLTRPEKFWKSREQAWRGLCHGERGVCGVELQPSKLGGGRGKAGETGKRGAVFGLMPWGIWPGLSS